MQGPRVIPPPGGAGPDRPVLQAFERIEIVLVRPQHPGNVGAAARAMKNMGLSRLVLVDPCDHRQPEAYRMAYGARDVLERARTAKSLSEAVSDAALVVGTTVRPRKGYIPLRYISELAPEILSVAGRQQVALVFGPEQTGLTGEEVARCQRLAVIATASGTASLNLAQAVLIAAYELVRQSARPIEPPERSVASSRVLEWFYEDLKRLLCDIEFLKDRQGRIIMLSLREVFNRAALDEREVRILRGIIRQVRWAIRQGQSGAGGPPEDQPGSP